MKQLRNMILLLVFVFGTGIISPAANLVGGAAVITAEAASKVVLSKKTVSLVAGEKTEIKLKNTSSKKKVTWSSSNKKVVTVKKSGTNGSRVTITAKKAGTANVTAKYNGKKYTCKVTVVSPSLSQKRLTIYANSTVTITLKNPVKGKKTVWESSNPEAVSIVTGSNKAVITGNMTGSSTITATHNGKKYTCKVTVKTIASSITITNNYTGNLKVGETGQFRCIVRPANAGATIKWSSSNTRVAVIDSKGRVTAKSAGTAVITAKTSDGSRLSKSMKITVVGSVSTPGETVPIEKEAENRPDEPESEAVKQSESELEIIK